eukprot:gene23801-28855_t
MKEGEQEALLNVTKAMYWVASEDIAVLKYPSLSRTLLPSLSPSISMPIENEKTKDANYANRSAAGELIEAITSCLDEHLTALLHNSPVLSWQCDETADIAKKKQLIIYVTCLEDGVTAVSAFMTLVNVECCDAITILNAIKSEFAKRGVDPSKITANGSDGASVFTGIKSGVYTKWKELVNPHSISQHCNCHKFALGTKNANEEVPYYKEYEGYVSSTYGIVARSAKRAGELNKLQIATGEK